LAALQRDPFDLILLDMHMPVMDGPTAVQKIRAGGSGVWGAVPMPPQPIAEADARTIARWIAETSAR
jgi:CheY-like chemotaxis protein